MSWKTKAAEKALRYSIGHDARKGWVTFHNWEPVAWTANKPPARQPGWLLYEVTASRFYASIDLGESNTWILMDNIVGPSIPDSEVQARSLLMSFNKTMEILSKDPNLTGEFCMKKLANLSLEVSRFMGEANAKVTL